MKQAIVLFAVLFGLWACDHRDGDGGGLRPPIPISPTIRCLPWDGSGPPISVDSPPSVSDIRKLHLCFVTPRTKKACGLRRAGCYYGCPEEGCDGD